MASFSNDDYCKVGFADVFLGSHIFSYQSLLLNTTVLNDTHLWPNLQNRDTIVHLWNSIFPLLLCRYWRVSSPNRSSLCAVTLKMWSWKLDKSVYRFVHILAAISSQMVVSRTVKESRINTRRCKKLQLLSYVIIHVKCTTNPCILGSLKSPFNW